MQKQSLLSQALFDNLSHHIPVQEGDDLGTDAIRLGLESGRGLAGGDAFFHRPKDGFIIVGIGLHIVKGIVGILRLGLTRCAPQECDHLAVGAG